MERSAPVGPGTMRAENLFTVVVAKRTPKLFIRHAARMLSPPMRVDTIPSVPFEDVTTLRANARALERDFSLATRAG